MYNVPMPAFYYIFCYVSDQSLHQLIMKSRDKMNKKLEIARRKTKLNDWKTREDGKTLTDTKNKTLYETSNDSRNRTKRFNKHLNGAEDKKESNLNRSKRGTEILTGSNCTNSNTCNII